MVSTTYMAITKDFLDEGIELGFGLYIALNSNKEIFCIKENGSCITTHDRVIIDTAHVLYVQEAEYLHYEQFHKNFLNSQFEQKTINISEQVAEIYTNASKVLNELFENPETLGNYEASKIVVKEIVEVVLDNEFTIKSLLDIATHDYYTHTHSINVAIYALTLGSFIGLTQTQLSELGEAALLHDLGKSKVDISIINKNGKLTDEEFEEIKKHPNHGYSIALKLGVKNRNILNGIRHHHEKMDGSGYPFKMQGESIPLFARIIGLCDIFDALTSRRSYKEPMSTFEALRLIKVQMSKHIDTSILNQMILMFR